MTRENNNNNATKHISTLVLVLFAIAAIAIFLILITIAIKSADGYDVTPTTDTHAEAAKSLSPNQIYRFGDSKDNVIQYTDGTTVPTRTFSIERFNQTTQEWETIGYFNVHLHKVKIDETDVEDISVGTTARINPRR